MIVLRRALAVVPIVAAAAALAAPANAATVKTEPCVRFVEGQKTMTTIGEGFTPGGSVSLSTVTKARQTPAVLDTSPVTPAGTFVQASTPPAFSSPTRNLESFLLFATETTNPAVPLLATTPFQVVRFGLTTSPTPKRPTEKVTYTARGFVTGRPVYIHFRFGGKTRRTVTLGVANGPCGIASKRMRALPTAARYGVWTSYTDQTKKFSAKTRPAWRDSFTIFRRAG